MLVYYDDCDVCSGGSTDHDANSDQDCNGDCFGAAFIDGCSECVGGNTGLAKFVNTLPNCPKL